MRTLHPSVKTWLHGASFGILALLTVGLFYATETGRSYGVTGLAVYEPDSVAVGHTQAEKIIVYGCQLSPSVIRAQRGQPLALSFTAYDPTGRVYRLFLDYGQGQTELAVKGREVARTIIVPGRAGNFDFAVYEPCEEFGIEAKGRLEVR